MGNSVLVSIELKANALDWSGCPVADASVSCDILSHIPHDKAYGYYNQIRRLITEMNSIALRAKKEAEIERLEKELKNLKDADE